MSYIEFINVSKSFGENQILKDINLAVGKNEFVTLLGPSGCGKTTLLRILAGLESLDRGRIVLDGENVTNKDPGDRNIGMIFQSYSLFPTMNVYNNVAYGLKMANVDKKTIKKEVLAALDSVDMGDKIKRYPAQLSGGEQQRVALARSIVMKPKVLLLDEPFNAIDAKLRKTLQLKVRELHDEYEMTSIMVTHDQDEAMIMSDTIHLLKGGAVEQSGSSTDLYLSPRTEYVASFMGNYNVIEGKAFSKITSNEYMGTQTVVLRPESIQIESAKKKENLENVYRFEGEIKDCIPQGNIVRFIVVVGDIKLNVDTLIDDLPRYSINQKVYLYVDLDKVLYYD